MKYRVKYCLLLAVLVLAAGCATTPPLTIHDAVCKGDLKGINNHIDEGAGINSQDRSRYGATPLQVAVMCGQESAAELLIERGVEVDNQGGQITGTPLYVAAYSGKIAIAKLLIAKGADVNAKCPDKSTPLHAAADGGHVSMAKLLIDNGADVNAKARFGATPLHHAVGHSAVAELLINSGAEIDAKTQDGKTPLDYAISLGYKKVAQLLQRHGSRSTEEPPSPDSFLLMAVLDDDLEKAKQSLKQGAHANLKEPISGRAILGFPAIEGHFAMVKLLLDYGADIEEELLTFVASSGHYSVAKLLIENGADVNERDRDKSTPLHHAALQGHLSVAKLLIEKGANINARNSKGETPLDLAVRHSDITKLLKRHGAKEGQSLEEEK